MRFSSVLTASAIVGSAIAAPALQHEHQNKRDIVVTTTVERQITVVVEGPAPTTDAAATASVDVSTVLDNDTTTTSTTAAAAATTAETSSAVENQTTTLVNSESTAASSTTSVNTSSTVAAGSAKGITYSPYNADGSCKSASEVASDLSALTDFGIIRLYGVDCDQVSNVLQAKTSSQKLFLGIYYVDAIESGVETIKAAVEEYGSWDDIYTVSIGNELVNDGEATVSQISEYVSTGRSALEAAGYTGPVVSVDTFVAVINNPGLCNYSDYMAVNAHAYFDKYTVAANAGPWLLQQIQRVWSACGGKKDVVIVESGWPSKGDTYGVAVPSKANQKAAISSIIETCGDDTILFTAYNDYWKADGDYGVEKYWGIFSD